eukprot:TRINITY_DN2526_c0_g1_i1.p1 TRINITY_DN2526_c0_g1~~TRINITY_DN2526_c0_g1_i1.p1  ORF type:complete len:484 (-),score=63.68 TRINITY_DN2526_c0_g1_i1:177-1628(-)
MKPNLSGLRGDSGPAPGIQALIAADPLSLVLADLTHNISVEGADSSTERPSRRRKRSQSAQEDSETSKAVEAIRAAAKIALMSNDRDDEDEEFGDDEDDEADADLGDDHDDNSGRKRRKLDDSSSAKSKEGKKQNSASFMSEEEKRAKKKESNNVKKVKERQRRSKMSESIHELRRLLPQCRDDKKANQSVVMMRAVEYIKHLEALLERALLENQKFRQVSATVGVVDPAPGNVTPQPNQLSSVTAAPPAFDSTTFVFPSNPHHAPLAFGDPRYAFAAPSDQVASRAPKSSAFCSPARVFMPNLHVHSSVSALHSDVGAFDAKSVNRLQGLPSGGPDVRKSTESSRSDSPALRQDMEPNVSTHTGSHIRHRAGKGMKGQLDGSLKHPSRLEWPSKAPLNYHPTHDVPIDEMHLAGDIEEVDGEWPLFFQRPYLNSDFANDNHISLDIPQSDGFGFSFDNEHDSQRQGPSEQERVSLGYNHAIR